MNASTHIAKLVALLPVVALAAACNGASPSGPSNVSTPDSGTASSSSTGADIVAPQDNASCREIDVVNLRVVQSGAMRVRLQAVYGYETPTTNPCPIPPKWRTSRGTLVVERDGFHASVDRSSTDRTTVTATAPNGVIGSITF